MGYLIAVDHDTAANAKGWVPDSFALVFEGADKAYYRCEQTIVLDDTVGDVHSLIFEREQAVLRGLETAILEHQAELCMVSEALGELDVIVALAEVAEVRLGADIKTRPVCNCISRRYDFQTAFLHALT